MMLGYTMLGMLQLATVLRYPTELDWSRPAVVVYVCFLLPVEPQPPPDLCWQG